MTNPDQLHPKHAEPSPPVAPTKAEYARLSADQRELQNAVARTSGKSPIDRIAGEGGAANMWLRYSALGIQMTLTMLLPALGGWWLDSEYGFEPWGLIGGAMLGVIAGMYSVITFVNRMERKDKTKE